MYIYIYIYAALFWRRFWLALYSEFLVSGFELGAFSWISQGLFHCFLCLRLSLPFQRGHRQRGEMQQLVFKERYIAAKCESLFKPPAQKMRKHSLCVCVSACVLEWESLEFFAVHAAVQFWSTTRTIALRSNCLSIHIEKLLLDFFPQRGKKQKKKKFTRSEAGLPIQLYNLVFQLSRHGNLRGELSISTLSPAHRRRCFRCGSSFPQSFAGESQEEARVEVENKRKGLEIKVDLASKISEAIGYHISIALMSIKRQKKTFTVQYYAQINFVPDCN